MNLKIPITQKAPPEICGIYPVLDHGFVELVDFMGSDQDIVEAARVTHASQTKGSPTADATLLRYLFRHHHASPFECCVIKLHVKLPIFVERQWARHRTAGWNEVSGRYCQLPEEYYIPTANAVAAQSTTNKQGRDATSPDNTLPVEVSERYLDNCESFSKLAFNYYKGFMSDKIANELSRIVLPLSTYTEKYWWINLRNLLHFLGLRMDSHAQWEIRQYANIIASIAKALFPITFQAFEDYQLNAVTFSAGEMENLMQCLSRGLTKICTREQFRVDFTDNKREQEEFKDKLERLGYFA
jgi:thymidylate synthase (FAD)